MTVSGRQLARPGLSYLEANSGRLVTETAELLDMKAQIRSRWPSLDVYFDHYERKFIVTQMCDGVEKFVLSRPYCGDRILADIAKCDPSNPSYRDPIEEVDKYNEKVERERDRELEEIAGDFGERFLHALKKDGLLDHEDIYGAKPKSQGYKNRSVR